MMRPNWFKESIPVAPAVSVKPHLDRSKSQAEFAAPFCQGLSPSVKPYDLIAPAVKALLRCGFPSAIFGVISCVIVYSANAASIWSVPHVGKEVLELSPTKAHVYSPSSIPRVCSTGRVCASVDNSRPNLVYPGLGQAMSCPFLVSKFDPFAPAAFRLSRCKVGTSIPFYRPADASTLIMPITSNDKPKRVLNYEKPKLVSS